MIMIVIYEEKTRSGFLFYLKKKMAKRMQEMLLD